MLGTVQTKYTNYTGTQLRRIPIDRSQTATFPTPILPILYSLKLQTVATLRSRMLFVLSVKVESGTPNVGIDSASIRQLRDSIYL